MTITVYEKPRCQQCTATKRWLTERGHDFEKADATEPGNFEAIKYLGYLQAPVIIVAKDDGTEEHWSGFRPDLLDVHVGGEKK